MTMQLFSSINDILIGIIAGIIGTYAMDMFNSLLSRWKLIASVNPVLLGRLAEGWVRGRFIYENPAQVSPVKHERLKGTITHYLIGAVLGTLPVLFIVLHFDHWVYTIVYFTVYGAATTVFAYFFLFPSIGMGFMGIKSPPETPMMRTALVNHINYGLGMGVAFYLLKEAVRLI